MERSDYLYIVAIFAGVAIWGGWLMSTRPECRADETPVFRLSWYCGRTP
jgi:hypothetical protein